MDVSARQFLFAITFAASLSFVTLVGCQTNTMIYNPGRYKVTDFVKIRTPLSKIMWVVGSIVILIIWPF